MGLEFLRCLHLRNEPDKEERTWRRFLSLRSCKWKAVTWAHQPCCGLQSGTCVGRGANIIQQIRQPAAATSLPITVETASQLEWPSLVP
jgi:hypothetical protein